MCPYGAWVTLTSWLHHVHNHTKFPSIPYFTLTVLWVETFPEPKYSSHNAVTFTLIPRFQALEKNQRGARVPGNEASTQFWSVCTCAPMHAKEKELHFNWTEGNWEQAWTWPILKVGQGGVLCKFHVISTLDVVNVKISDWHRQLQWSSLQDWWRRTGRVSL